MRRNTSVLFVLVLLFVADALCINYTLRSGESINLYDTVRSLSFEAVAAIVLILLSGRLLLPAVISLKQRYLKKDGFSVRQPLRRLFVSVWF